MDSAYNANQYPGYWRFGTGCKASTQTNNAYCYGNLKQTSATSWTYSIQAKYLVANQNAIWLVGTRKDRWGPFPLPLDLTPLGVTGCTLYTSIALAIPCRTDGSGGLNTSGSPLTIPYDPMLRGLSLYSQCACADPGRAPLPVVFTDGCDNPLHPNTQPLTRILHNSNDLATTASHRYLQRGLVVRFGYK